MAEVFNCQMSEPRIIHQSAVSGKWLPLLACVQAAKGEVATELGDVLREAGMSEVLPLPKARVPVVKFVVPETGTKVSSSLGEWGLGEEQRRGKQCVPPLVAKGRMGSFALW